jgi:hypothetical protein
MPYKVRQHGVTFQETHDFDEATANARALSLCHIGWVTVSYDGAVKAIYEGGNELQNKFRKAQAGS